MDEPVKKKVKKSDIITNDDLEIVQSALLAQCLCTISESQLRKTFQKITVLRDADIHGNTTTYIPGWSRDRTILFLSSLELLCEIGFKQNIRGQICATIGELCDALVRNDHGLVENLIDLSAHSDPYICFTSGRALSAFLIVTRNHTDTRWLEKITNNALLLCHPRRFEFSLNVLKRILEYKDVDEHPLHDQSDFSVISSCHIWNLRESDIDSSHLKGLCIRALEVKWICLVQRVERLLSSNCNQAAIITFLGLWESIISVRANLSITDTRPFFIQLEALLNKAQTGNVSPIVWRHLLSLFNEALCYGSTLALQDSLPEETCALAHVVVRGVKDRRLLEVLPASDRVLMQKAVLLVLKAVAVTVKESRCESSSASEGSGGEEADADMAVIERSMGEVLRRIDDWVKGSLPFHPSTSLAQWVVQLLGDQDDTLIEAMICLLDIRVGLLSRPDSSQELSRILTPSMSLGTFLSTVSYDHQILLDLLVSNETCFLLYLLRILKYARRNWSEFKVSLDVHLGDVMDVFARLRNSIERLVSRALFPYNINPITKLLEKIEQLYKDVPFH